MSTRISDVVLVLMMVFVLYALGGHSLLFTVNPALDIDSLHAIRAMGDPFRRAGYIVFAVAGLIAHRLAGPAGTRNYTSLRLCVIFTFSWMAISVAWSRITPLSLKEELSALLVWLACAAIASRISLGTIRTIAIIYTGCAITLGLFCELALSTFRPLMPGYRFSGTVYPNIQGVICAICIISLISFNPHPRHMRAAKYCAILISTTLLLLTQSRDSIVAVFVAGVVIELSAWTKRSLVSLVAGISLFVIATISVFLLMYPGMTRQDVIGAATLQRDTVAADGVGDTRLAIWKECLPLLANHPIVGYGYGAFWSEDRVATMSDQLGFIALHAHNGYLDAALNTGLIGCLVFTLMLIMALRVYLSNYRMTRRSNVGFAAAIVIFFVTHLLLESFYVTGVETILTLCVVMRLAFANVPFDDLDTGSRAHNVKAVQCTQC